METDHRPNPDLLLRRIQSEETRHTKASLKIFFGYAPGVGKTYAMLASAAHLIAQGVDVAVGCVETHGRPETAALLDGMDILPRREWPYRGTILTEFDLDRALARKPKVLILDELAHTNAPGSRNKKRWQDVLELLENGIDVHTTLNIQHVESLNDVITQITSIRIRETIPDSILEQASELELIDLPPEELLQRLREGKVYLPEQAGRAIDHFFRRGNLLALRELTLRRAAERIDVDVQAYRQDFEIQATWPAAERLLVCVGPSPSTAKILRGACRIATGLRAQWIAVYVDAPDAYPMNATDRERLQGHLRLAESLGAKVFRLSGHKVADEILRYARENNITRIVIGKPTHSRLRDHLKGSLVNQIVRGSGDIEVHFIAGDDVQTPQPNRTIRKSQSIPWTNIGVSMVTIGVITVVALALQTYLSPPDIVILFLLGIMLVSFRHDRKTSIITATLAVAAYDFFFVPPYFTFSVEHLRHLLTFLMMFIMGLVVSGLTTRLRRQESDARQRESRTSALYSLSRELAAAQDETRTAKVTAIHAADVFGGEASVLMPGASDALSIRGISREGIRLSDEELAVARWVADHGRMAGCGTDTLPGARITCIPIQTGTSMLGVLALATPSAEFIAVEHREFLDAFVRQAALSLERAHLVEDSKTAILKIKAEETRSALLGAVSHDLRTPLGAITGAGTVLRDDRGKLDPSQHTELCDLICTEAERMERLVSNILDMVRLESGGITPKYEWVPLEETIGSALSRLDAKLGTRTVIIDIPPDLPLLSVDPVLFEQVFINLIENIIKHCSHTSPIEISARVSNGMVEIDVADRGPGLPTGYEERIFEKFYRGPQTRTSGVGLGLSICKGIMASHNGTISARNRIGGGAVICILLPVPEISPVIQPENETEFPDQEL